MNRTFWTSSFCAVLLAALASAASAQQAPTSGCNASPSCRQNGFSVLTGQDKEHTGPAFGVQWGPGFHFGLLRHDTETPGVTLPTEGRFHLQPPEARRPLSSPETDFTPVAPAPPAEPRPEPPRPQ